MGCKLECLSYISVIVYDYGWKCLRQLNNYCDCEFAEWVLKEFFVGHATNSKFKNFEFAEECQRPVNCHLLLKIHTKRQTSPSRRASKILIANDVQWFPIVFAWFVDSICFHTDQKPLACTNLPKSFHDFSSPSFDRTVKS